MGILLRCFALSLIAMNMGLNLRLLIVIYLLYIQYIVDY